ncbi:uncharacterized protein LOC115765719 [Drosophila novamexicana]|uniref:uncharacterized protein LOC115765719 n=1 Tax=Drosophila novamexicana TaxID=47314 RepID=UPI0011E59349|nr:uncharacterized protein LOC115765719 [Drosophila novamexicana]
MQLSEQFSKFEQVPYVTTHEAIRLERIYLVASLFTGIGMGQLVLIKAARFDLHEIVPVPSFMWLVIALVCLVLLVFTELFNKFPINWTLGTVTVESMTLCVICYNWTTIKFMYATIIVVTILATNLFLYLMGAFLPLSFLPGYKTMLVTTIVFIIVYILLVVVVFAIKMPVLMVLVDSWSLLYMLPLTLYGSTIIHHRRSEYLVSEEYVLSATIITAFLLYMIHLLASVVTYSLQLHKTFA